MKQIIIPIIYIVLLFILLLLGNLAEVEYNKNEYKEEICFHK